MEDLEEFKVGAKIQRRHLMRVVKKAQESGTVDVSEFPDDDLASFAKRVREIQRERLKNVDNVDLSFLNKSLMDESEEKTSENERPRKSGRGGLTLAHVVYAFAFAILSLAAYKRRDMLFRAWDTVTASSSTTTTSRYEVPHEILRPDKETSSPTTPARVVDERKDGSSSASSTPLQRSKDAAQKCFSMAPSASRWKHEYTYPADAAKHYEDILDATQPFRIQPFHSYAGYAGPWIENRWIFSFMGRPLSAFGPYIPIFIQWTDIVLLGEPTYKQIEDTLLKVLRPDVMYVTVVQGAEGLKSVGELFPNILVLSSGGMGHVPIPLLKAEQPRTDAPRKRSSVVTFVGKMLANRRSIVNDLRSTMAKEFEWYRGNEWTQALLNAHFALTPRGFGRTSFNVYEALQLGVVPIYVWDDVEWLPYRGSKNADWDSFALSVNVKNVRELPQTLTTQRASIERKRAKVRELRESHFTYDGVLNQIELFMRGGEALSDLRCTRMPNDAGVLSYGEGLEGIFGVLETDGDDLISFKEFYAGFREFKVRSVTEPNLDITASFSIEEGKELWSIMDTNQDSFIDYEEWMLNYPKANDRMKALILKHQSDLHNAGA